MTAKASIFAGGAGKTTAYFELVNKQIDLGRRINACKIAWSIGDHKDSATQIRASRIALTLRKMYLDEARIYDNSDTLKLIAQIKNSKILEFKQTKWLKELNI
ncbi:MAG: hypothetical protein MR481_06520 [Campylobacter sp.]|uniref:hypothetical protein n=1 Tax=Campylobacter sp. TaxID=205 RepID=UPI002AA6B6B4|nr:hypothetical protein [Campylobacter sp.]MCI7247559.1 hypothetical protein [Campylobacter sp.]